VERAVIALGLFELVFLLVAWKAQPHLSQVAAQWLDQPLTHSDYLYLVAANLGTCIMPWAIFYQQSALIDKGLNLRHLRMMRVDTLVGAVLCQCVTAAILVAAAASFGALHQGGAAFETVGQISSALTGVLGNTWGRLAFAVVFSGGALVATVVVCLTAAWALGELTGVHHSLEQHPMEAPWFYAAFALMLLLGGGLVLSGVGVVRLSIAMGVLNALLLPFALGSLYALARSPTLAASRLQGPYAGVVALAFAAVAAVGVVAGLVGVLG
jgi:Mn2+/Fe2+ NRAMP family transporter